MNPKMAAIKKKVTGAFKAPKEAIWKVTSPIKGRAYDSMRKTIKDARNYDNAPNFDEKGNATDAYKTRFLAKEIKRNLPIK